MIVREFFALLGLEADERDFAAAEKALAGIKSAAEVVVGAVAAVGAAFGLAARDTIQHATELDRWSKITGESIERLDALGSAAEALGADAEKTFEGMSELADKATDIVKNLGKLAGNDAADGFKILGYTSVNQLKKANGELRDLPELFDEVLTRLGSIENQGIRTGVAMQLFGDDTGLALAALDVDELRALRDTMLETGVVMNEDAVKAAKAFRGSFSLVLSLVDGLKNRFVVGVLPALTGFLDKVRDWITLNREIVKQRLDQFVEKVSEAVRIAADTVGRWAEALGRLVEWLGGLKRASYVLGGILVALAAYFWPVTLAVGALGLVIDDVIGYFTGAESVLGHIINKIGALGLLGVVLTAVFGPIGAIVTGVIALVRDLMSYFDGGESVVVSFFQSIGDAIRTYAIKAVDAFLGFLFDSPEEIEAVKDRIIEIVGRIIGAFSRLFARVGRILSKAFDTWVSIWLPPLKAIGNVLLFFIVEPLRIIIKETKRLLGFAGPLKELFRLGAAKAITKILGVNVESAVAQRDAQIDAAKDRLIELAKNRPPRSPPPAGAGAQVDRSVKADVRTNITINGNATPESLEEIRQVHDDQVDRLREAMEDR